MQKIITSYNTKWMGWAKLGGRQTGTGLANNSKVMNWPGWAGLGHAEHMLDQ
jgi:hypothetical protein